jgi:hypothetical protein
MNTNTVDTKRIAIFLAVAFGFAWLMALIIYLTGGLVNSPELIGHRHQPGAGAGGGGLHGCACPGQRGGAPGHTRRLAKCHAAAQLAKRLALLGGGLVVPALFPIAGAALFFILFPQYYDADLTLFRTQLAGASEAVRAMNPWLLIVIQLLQALILAPLFNSLSTFGEEFGWRAYLLPKLLPLASARRCCFPASSGASGTRR